MANKGDLGTADLPATSLQSTGRTSGRERGSEMEMMREAVIQESGNSCSNLPG